MITQAGIDTGMADLQDVSLARPKPIRKIIPALFLIGFSLLYFVDVALRALGKDFWFDELCTLYISRLPTFHESWQAVLHGVDYNPPLYYALTRASYRLFGEGHVFLRLPDLIGFWILSLCLFRVVHRRAGVLAGSIAMMLPMLTGAYFYAYEARPHGVVLGFCGLAIACWQMSIERSRSWLWVLGFSLSLAGAFFTHCYAVLLFIPFAVAEAFRTLRFRRFDWWIWLAMTAPLAAACLSFIPLLRSYREVLKGTGIGKDYFAPSFAEVATFYNYLLSPCILLLVLAVFLFALDRLRFVTKPLITQPGRNRQFWTPEIIVALMLALLPLFGVLIAESTTGPFVLRYFMSAVAGFSMLLGLSAGASRTSRNWVSMILPAALGCVIFGTTWSDFAQYLKGEGAQLVEPSTGIRLNTTHGKPLAIHSLLADNLTKPLPIVVENLNIAPLFYYKPELAPRLYFLNIWPDEAAYRLFAGLNKWCHVNYNLPTIDEFLSKNPHFLVYGDKSFHMLDIKEFVNRKAEIDLFEFDMQGDHFIAEVRMKTNTPSR